MDSGPSFDMNVISSIVELETTEKTMVPFSVEGSGARAVSSAKREVLGRLATCRKKGTIDNEKLNFR